MNIYWLNPPLSTRSFYCDLAWMNFKTLIKNIVDLYTKINFKCTIATKNSISNDRKNTICSTQNSLDQTKIKQMKDRFQVKL